MSSKFLIDSNAIIEPFNTFYPFDFAGSFWSQLKEKIDNKDVIILDLVRDEIRTADDELTDWIKTISEDLIMNIVNPNIIGEFSKILDYIQHSNLYKDSALDAWSDAKVADAWLIATAKVHNYTIVTFEKPNLGINANNPSRNAKIPDIAMEFNVECCDLYKMMRALKFSL